MKKCRTTPEQYVLDPVVDVKEVGEKSATTYDNNLAEELIELEQQVDQSPRNKKDQ